jgi:hypothetical protein
MQQKVFIVKIGTQCVHMSQFTVTLTVSRVGVAE